MTSIALMPQRNSDFPDFPATVPQSTAARSRLYRIVLTHFAQHGPADPSSQEPTRVTIRARNELCAMAAAKLTLTPVYCLGAGAPLAVPTGKVFVRLARDQSLADHADHFREAGYEIIQTLPYARHAGWLRPVSGSIAAALSGVRRLASLPEVENVEPQMLMRAVRRK